MPKAHADAPRVEDMLLYILQPGPPNVSSALVLLFSDAHGLVLLSPARHFDGLLNQTIKPASWRWVPAQGGKLYAR